MCGARASEMASRDAYRSGHVVYLGFREEALCADDVFWSRICYTRSGLEKGPVFRLSAVKILLQVARKDAKHERLWLGRRGVSSPMQHWGGWGWGDTKLSEMRQNEVELITALRTALHVHSIDPARLHISHIPLVAAMSEG